MKRLLMLMTLVLLMGASATDACDGMLSLFADQSGGNCSGRISYCTPVPLYLLYIRGTGPEIAPGVAFRLRKSTPGVLFLEPQWEGEDLSAGSLETGIDVVFHAGEHWCSGDASVACIGTIPVVNLSDPDTFTVTVVDQPVYGGIYVVQCEQGYPMYRVTGGTFVFNGRCKSAEDPFGVIVAVAQSSWGAIKGLYR